ncbi:MAG: hypothetical protein O2854_04560 [Chloroflexi bacterium]|nr:hypothetical protein [Chloroflexota bacterium]
MNKSRQAFYIFITGIVLVGFAQLILYANWPWKPTHEQVVAISWTSTVLTGVVIAGLLGWIFWGAKGRMQWLWVGAIGLLVLNYAGLTFLSLGVILVPLAILIIALAVLGPFLKPLFGRKKSQHKMLKH